MLVQLVLAGISLKAQITAPVNLYTGKPQISIPIYSLSSAELSLPVSLSYSPGIKVAQQNGSDEYNLGVGWSLAAGGGIVRTMKGLPDDYKGIGTDTRAGWIYGSGAADGAMKANLFAPQTRTDCSGDVTNYTTLNGLANNLVDTEPDVFSFSFGSYSGKFFFDNNKVIQVAPYQDLKIQPEYTASGDISTINFTTPNGVKYKFIPTQRVAVQVLPAGNAGNVLYLRGKMINCAQQITYTTSWGLTSIISPGGGMINLSYSSHQLPLSSSPTEIYLNTSTSGTNYKNSLYNTQVTTTQSYLSSVSGGSVSLLFDYGNDLSLNGFTLISKSNSETSSPEMLKIALKYNQAAFRKYLISVQTYFNCVKNPAYTFEYQGINFDTGQSTLPEAYLGSSPFFPYTPQGTKGQIDYWGYYNANTTASFVPNIYVYPSEPLPERYRFQPIPSYAGTYYFLSGGADRSVNPLVISAGSLSKINFPAGGSLSLVYEPNQYMDLRTGETYNGGGIRVKSTMINDGSGSGNNIVKNYSYAGGRLLNKPQLAFSLPVYSDAGGTPHTIEQYADQASKVAFFTARSGDDLNDYSLDEPEVVYQSGTESQTGKGKVTCTYSIPATFSQISSPEYTGTDQWEASLSRYATTTNPGGGCNSKGLLEDGYYGFPFPVNPNYDFERGLLLNDKRYNEAGKLVKETQYIYSPIYKVTTPAFVYGLALDYFTYNNSDQNTKAFSYSKYKLYTGITKSLTSEREITYDPATDYSTSAVIESASNYNDLNNHMLLSSTGTNFSSDGTNNTTIITRYKYPQDYTINISPGGDSSSVALQGMKDNFMNNAIIEKVTSIIKPGGSEQVTSATLNKYKYFTVRGDNSQAPDQQRLLLAEALKLKTNTPLSNFVNSAINASFQFINDSRYTSSERYLDYNLIGNKLAAVGDARDILSFHYDITKTLPVAMIKNATANQVVYSSFDDAHRQPYGSTSYSFDPVTNYTQYNVVSGRTGDALALSANFTFKKPGVYKATTNKYVFSCWVKSTSAGSMLVTLNDVAGHVVNGPPITYTNTAGIWTLYTISIPVGTLNPIFEIQVNTTTAVSVDDMLFYPESAQVSLTSYKHNLKMAETDTRGNTTFYTYDDVGRPVLVKDDNSNILKRTIYSYKQLSDVNAYFSIYENVAFNPQSSAQINTPVNFLNDFATACEQPGIVRNWDFGDGTILNNGGANPSHTYTVMPVSGYYLVTLTLTSPTFGTVSSTRKIMIQYPHPVFNVYACGIVEYDLCNQIIRHYGTDLNGNSCGATYPLGKNIFTAISSVSSCPGGSATYKWEVQTDGNSYWTPLSGTSNTVTVQLPNLGPNNTIASSQSYTVRCTIFPGCNAQSVSQTYHILFDGQACNK